MLAFVAAHPAACVALVMLGFAALEWRSGALKPATETAEDAPLEAAITLLFAAVIYPTVLLLVGVLGQAWAPGAAGALAGLPVWQMVVLFLLADDLTQYAWHRASHTPLLWPLHRAHHSAPYMSIRIVYRNNFFYYAMMPGMWLSAILVYLGLGAVYPFYLVVKLAVICGAHSSVRWDAPLYRIRWLRPLAWLLEHTISTPATHFAHHAMFDDDGIGHYKGNYGNLLFVWDQLFGTAHFSRRYPPQVGLVDDVHHGPEPWYVQLFYPLLKSRRASSALAATPVIVARVASEEPSNPALPSLPGNDDPVAEMTAGS
jgi:sterol desaturase/sphingolipid hydroxylase (fatty acid hydroxylase superfamily)